MIDNVIQANFFALISANTTATKINPLAVIIKKIEMPLTQNGLTAGCENVHCSNFFFKTRF